MEKYIKDGKVAVLLGVESLFALHYPGGYENCYKNNLEKSLHKERMFDPDLVKLLLKYEDLYPKGEDGKVAWNVFYKYTDAQNAEYEVKATKLNNEWLDLLSKKYPNLLDEMGGAYKPPRITYVDLIWVEEGTEFAVANRNDFDDHSYGEQIIFPQIVKA